jgi:hypothetical protein
MPPEDDIQPEEQPTTRYEEDMRDAQRAEAEAKERAREVYKGVTKARDQRVGAESQEEEEEAELDDEFDDETTEDAGDDEPLPEKGRKSLARDLGLTGELKYDDEGNLVLTKDQARQMASKAGERSGLVDDLFRRLAEAGIRESTSSETESGAEKPSPDEPVFTDEELEPLREAMGDEFADKLKRALEAPSKKVAEVTEAARAERALLATFQSLSGEFPDLARADAIDKYSPTVVALLRTGDYADLETAVRAAYSAKGGKVKSRRKRVANRRARHLDGQPPEPGTRERAKAPSTEKEKQREFYRRLKGGQSRQDAMRGAGLSVT